MKRVLSLISFLAFFSTLFLFLSRMPLRPGDPGDCALLLTVQNAPKAVGNDGCRPATEAEKAKMLPHMRRDVICERARKWTTVRVELDGKSLSEKSYKPLGFSSDGMSVAFENFWIPVGSHQISVRVRDSVEGDRWDHVWESSQDFKAGRRYLVEFQGDRGFKFYPRTGNGS